MEKLGILAFIILIITLLYMDVNRDVDVYICGSGGVTHYVGREKPPCLLSLGECEVVRIPNFEYHDLRRIFNQGRL